MQYQITILNKTLENIKNQVPFNITDEFIYKVHKWADKLEFGISSEEELKISHFLKNETIPYLKLVNQNYPNTAALTQSYFDNTLHNNGLMSENRSQVESSIQTINKTILEYLEHFQDELQASYPCYYETFRSDGIEYDFYLGLSLVPERPFNPWYLKNLRLWQLNGMAAIAKLTKALQTKLPKALETTQLIFVHAHPITISFRTDERRFDVEGAHNVQYEIIKKRIDKVHLINSQERLTQPDKIAIVYYNNREADEYTEYIQYLQERNVLNHDLEYLDLEELQGVTGLKALRVGVNYNI
ncbi:hypothetical protein [Adhaeribacter aquaticus]|uniref:hypothetical protein n=1 Tax=Adhaeribacter aquaticus TaxID=299567 RepID=UPI000411AB54|nr:hypothetical protein [Adhaeribacter aquaticus]